MVGSRGEQQPWSICRVAKLLVAATHGMADSRPPAHQQEEQTLPSLSTLLLAEIPPPNTGIDPLTGSNHSFFLFLFFFENNYSKKKCARFIESKASPVEFFLRWNANDEATLQSGSYPSATICSVLVPFCRFQIEPPQNDNQNRTW